MTWKCPKCGKPNLMSQTNCNRCGTSRPANYRSATFTLVSAPVVGSKTKR